MNNEELLAKCKALFPDNVEAIVVRKDDYDRLYGDLTKENIELKQEIERLNKCIKDDKENANEIIAEQQQEIERLNNIKKEVREILKFHLSNPSGTKKGWHIDIWNSEDISRLDKHLEILDKINIGD